MSRRMPAAATGAVALLVTIGSGTALSAAPSLQGRWRLDLSRSEMLPGEALPAEIVMAIETDDGKAFRWTTIVTMRDGGTGRTSFDGAIDGRPYPVEGRPGSTSAFSWTADGKLKQVSQGPGGIAVETCTLDSGRRKLDCEVKQTDSQGRSVSYAESFDRL